MAIIIQPASYYCNVNDILNLRLVSKDTLHLIQECLYTDIQVTFNGNNFIEAYQTFKCFQNIKCPHDISDDEIKYLI